LRPWLLGVAINVLRNRGRSFRRHRAALDRLPPPPDEPDFADDLAGRMDDQRRMRALLALVGRLPQREQDALALCGWSGLSYEQAALALGVPVGTVRSRLSRARARLQKLERELGSGGGQAGGERRPALRPGEGER
jgi:RNA polymerase sigma-70 factor (ECF subfamily)